MSEAVRLEYEPLPAVAGVDAAHVAGAPRLHDGIERNVLPGCAGCLACV